MPPAATDGPAAAGAGEATPAAARHAVVLVLDYGSQYTQLIARRIREKGVYSMLLPGDATLVRERERGRAVLPRIGARARALVFLCLRPRAVGRQGWVE
jgi:GMP synthase (glutamine-hydrolysing)